MRCDYCFYCDEMDKREQAFRGMMSEDTVKNLIRKAMRQADREICFAFQGGEPTLRGIGFFRKVIEFEQRFNRNNVHVINTLQTNGFAIDDEWCRFFKEHDFLIGVSADGTETVHDRYRHDAAGGATYARIKKTTEMFDRYGVEYNIRLRSGQGRSTGSTRKTAGITSSISPVSIRWEMSRGRKITP